MQALMDTNKMRDLKALAEKCLQHQPLRFMRSHGALYIRNDNGIVFDVHQNRSFPDFMSQNKDYADLALACTPQTVLALLAEVESLERKNANQSESIREYQDLVMGGDVSLGMLKADIRVTAGERDQLKVENEALRKDAERYRFVRNPIGTSSPLAIWNEGKMPLFSSIADAVVDEFMAKEASHD
ncbi:hypothetical protein [Pseudomonas asiatica]|uniref:hypothetical protein n=1 Tax=Pseudomonas asiatica TaxID=2219225 RepID=UPI0010C09D3D|nr:hypothetical protein [Pseudomonas asiatica]